MTTHHCAFEMLLLFPQLCREWPGARPLEYKDLPVTCVTRPPLTFDGIISTAREKQMEMPVHLLHSLCFSTQFFAREENQFLSVPTCLRLLLRHILQVIHLGMSFTAVDAEPHCLPELSRAIGAAVDTQVLSPRISRSAIAKWGHGGSPSQSSSFSRSNCMSLQGLLAPAGLGCLIQIRSTR